MDERSGLDGVAAAGGVLLGGTGGRVPGLGVLGHEPGLGPHAVTVSVHGPVSVGSYQLVDRLTLWLDTDSGAVVPAAVLLLGAVLGYVWWWCYVRYVLRRLRHLDDPADRRPERGLGPVPDGDRSFHGAAARGADRPLLPARW